MNFTAAVSSGYNGYVKFAGRSARSEFWYWVLFQVIVSIIIGYFEGGGQSSVSNGMMNSSYNAGPIAMVWSLANFLPGLAVSVRRLHDVDKSGWWSLIVLIPVVGIIVLLVWNATKGTVGGNRFGADPLNAMPA